MTIIPRNADDKVCLLPVDKPSSAAQVQEDFFCTEDAAQSRLSMTGFPKCLGLMVEWIEHDLVPVCPGRDTRRTDHRIPD
jgi:hypothetical protein